MTFDQLLDWAVAPVMGVVGWLVADRAKTKDQLTSVITKAEVLDAKWVAIEKVVTKIDSRQEELIDFLLRERRESFYGPAKSERRGSASDN